MPTKYVHTNIVASNWQLLVTFYQEVFGCVPVPPQREQSGAWLEQATGVKNAALSGMHLRLPGYGDTGPTLEIFSYKEMLEKGHPAANRKGFGHIAFLVDDVASTRASILTHGGSDLGSITHNDIEGVGHLCFIYMADPEGNILEIQHWS